MCIHVEVLKYLKLFMQSIWPQHQVCIVASSSSSSMKMVGVFCCYVDDAGMVPTSACRLSYKNSGELIWRLASKNFMCRCVMNVEMCRVSPIILIFCLCKVLPVTIVLKSLFSN
jgi:hypothetical protein